jgi:hypothetical protein
MEALVDPVHPRFLVANSLPLLPTPGMDIKHLTSDTLRSLLSITSKKEQLIKAVADIENEIAKALKWPVNSVADVYKPAKRKIRSKKAKETKAAKNPAKSKKRKSGITPKGRARLAANMKALWAARRAGKPGIKIGKPAKKNLPKAGKNPF